MKKIILVFIIIIGAFLFVGCKNNEQNNNGDTDNHTHTYSSAWDYDDLYHYHSSTCGHDVVSDKAVHVYSNWNIAKEATASEEGIRIRTCEVCGYVQTEKISKLEHTHSYGEGVITKKATCTEQGIKTYTCSCGNSYTEKLDALGHNYVSEVTSPTYETQGYTTHTCSRCGDTYIDNYVEKLTRSYNVSFNLNGGECENGTSNKSISSLDSKEFFFDLTKSGYKFKGWSYNKKLIFDEKGNLINNVQLVDNMIFDAVFEEGVTLAVYYTLYDKQGNDLIETYESLDTSIGDALKTKDYNWNTYVDLFINLNNGYTFIGWYNENVLISSNTNYSYIMWNNDVEIEARFRYSTYELSIYSNNSNLGLVSIRNNSTEYKNEISTEKYYTEDVGVAASTKGNVRFLGWYDTDNKLISTNPIYTFNMPNSNYTLEAKWDLFSITYNLDGGVNSEANITTYATSDNNYTLASPTKEGYTFVGWKYGDEYINSINTKLAKDIELDAIWTYYTLQTCVNHISVGKVDEYNETKVTAGSEVTITASPTMDYDFLGWYDGNTLLSNKLTYTFNMPSKSIEYTAKWDIPSELSNFIYEKSDAGLVVTGLINHDVSEIIVPNDIVEIAKGAFSGCSSLESITLPFVGSSASATSAYEDTLFGYIFGTSSYTGSTATGQRYSSSNYTTYYIPTSLKEVTITGGNILYGAFYNCTSLTSITIPDSITSIGAFAFSGCTSLASIIIPDSITSIGEGAFSGCKSLTSITIPDSITSIEEGAFSGCKSLTSITIPDSITSIGSAAFKGCSSLKSITLPFVGSSASARGVSNSNLFGYIFGTSSYIGSTATKQYYSSSNYTTYYIPTSLKEVTITGGNILYGAFYNCTSLTSITIPDSITSIGSSAFSGCSSLESITLPFVGSSASATSAYENTSLTSITIPDSITSIGIREFYNCTSLTSITIPNSITSIGAFAFYNCTSLTSISIPDSVTWIGGYAFSGCTSLTSISIPDSVTWIGGYAFSGCSSLESITLPFVGSSASATSAYEDTLFGYIFGTSSYTGSTATGQRYSSSNYTTYYIPTSLKEVTITGGNILYGAFYNCTSLTSITIPDSITSIGSSAFYNCSSLTSITIPDSVTSIRSYAFENCSSLTSIVIPDSVTSIGVGAFYNCASLNNVYFLGTGNEWNNIIIGESNTYLTDATLYYYSNIEPNVDGNYWHYVDGIVTLWS